ncbi:exodeoxyribonuclease III [Corynebacterium epidermidicanis]|uniref:Exodeoxyribonuclease III n=1 Tax=Corynebacterium epidermidicanis TaxID=1050174 RepID=A0A0G3GWU4_9CORY|nr:exodeoxyribonuclease III [Corynebacterium epidermidicanis]AKK04023.1 Exodeoxyribonuclease III [Corynebacterium epidermidicanis]
MRIATWNINSVRTRIDRVTDFLARHDIDVLALQETKVSDDKFPHQAFTNAGYEVAYHGLNQWNGVAIASRVGLEDVEKHFPQQPGFDKDLTKPQAREARAIGATCDGVRIWSLYVPNGREIADPHYDYKLRWLDTLANEVENTLAHQPEKQLLLLGDFNIAPLDEDVWDISFFDGKTHVTEPERAAFDSLLEAGLTDVTRNLIPTGYTYWDYTAMRFQRGQGMRIDFHLASRTLATGAQRGWIDTEERATKGASDHAPVIVDYHTARLDDVR